MVLTVGYTVWCTYGMDLRTYQKGWTSDQRDEFAVACGTTAGHMRNISYGYKPCATDLAVRIEQHTNKAVSRRDLRPADWWLHWPELVTKRHQPPPVPCMSSGSHS